MDLFRNVCSLALVILPAAIQAQCGLGPNSEGEYLVSTYAELKQVGVGDCSHSSNYRISADIDASASALEQCNTDGCKGFTPIAIGTEFSGRLHGAGHVIRNLHIEDRTLNRAGLFAALGAATLVDSLGLENVWIKSGNNTGGISGYSEGVIKNCFVTGYVSGNFYTGGIIGYMGGGELGASYSSVQATTDYFVGGLVGGYYGGTIHDVYVNGITTPELGSLSNSNGGLVGYWSSGVIQRALILGPVQANRPVDVNMLRSLVGMNIFWGRDASGLSTGISSESLLDSKTLNGFDFTNVWEIPTGAGALHPVLRGMKNTPSTTTHAVTVRGPLYSTLKGFYEEQSSAALVTRKCGVPQWNASEDSLVTLFQIGAIRGLNDTLWGGFGRSTRATIPGLGIPVGSYEDLMTIGVNWPLVQDYYLESDIDASASSDGSFVPIGGSSEVYYGHFRGRGHVIRNLTIQKPDDNWVGLFAETAPGSLIDSLGMENIQVIGHNDVGGLVGYAQGVLAECYVTGKVTLNGYWDVGGLVGKLSSKGKILNSYTTAEVAGNTYTGGMVGDNYGYLKHVYAAGIVSLGFGLIGMQHNDTATVRNVWDRSVSGQTVDDANNSVGLTTAQMKQEAYYSGWDFQKTWYMDEGRTYPLLRAFMKPMTVVAQAITKTYDGKAFSNPVFNLTPTILDSSKFTGTLANTGNSLNAKNKGTYNITPGGLHTTGQAGYAIDYTDAPLKINAKEILLTGITAKNKVYDGTANAVILGTPLLTGVVKGESITVTGVLVGEFNSPEVGTDIPVQVTGYALSGTGSGNYSLTLPKDLVADITKSSAILRNPEFALTGNALAKVMDQKGRVVWSGVLRLQDGQFTLPAALQTGRWIVQLRLENMSWKVNQALR